ncbi:MAG: aldehyde dehydrogenase family protein [Candidatus Borkfalkiaceae bacterium]|nr:aldehyde dehydrogenase EutE [Clostridia bacterium]MDY6223440.1 aldehyde dehydrogenase family protein [Christensenellaceae bacterium]
MAINWTEAQIEEVVNKVLKNLGNCASTAAKDWDSTQYQGRKFIGIYADMNDAIDAATAGYKAVRAMSLEEREKIISAIRELCRKEAPVMAALGVAETKMGRVEHKTAKHILVADKTPGTADIVAQVKTGDYGMTLTEMAPFGVVGSITPSTNPSETVICNSIGMIAAGNGVVFNPHPNAIATSNYAVDLVNRASAMAGGPAVLVASMVKPTLESAQVMYKHPAVRLLVCTGGPGVVKSVLSSGKKAIGAGAGNPPVIVDDTADIKKAGKDIIDGCSFDNNLPCIAEKEVFAFRNIADELISEMLKNGAYKITAEQADKLAKIVLVESKNPKTGIVNKTVSRECVGRDAAVLLDKIGVKVGPEIRCIICETQFEHPFVQYELMMPILPIVRVDNIDQAIDLAVKAEHGNRHTAHMHSKNIDHLTRFARAVETTIFVKNAPSYAGIGFGGEGHTTFTIAGPTGEGLTSARSFTRFRRCVLSEAFRII